ncbi:hypothetical protein SAMN04488490_1850 [Marinobacter sp. LV10R510-11A]|uniref:hypothetical protein n=1 Tax=Marinobacter sp. LV10R510-11A TaxID=1415568 RepID=UPI000BB8F1F2|nr:hypothetical protein [Marinobacter sp. LV10R510-11A]SOB76172.1 hypothetical protein SAMN04488490_1850 [Marinobacter sp. LV10R510-11A]
MIPYAKPAIALIAVAGLTAGGWMARGWFEDSKELIAVTAQQALADEIRAGQAEVSKMVERRLSQLTASERVIDRGIIREIEKPVYTNVCIPPDDPAFRLLNDIASGAFARKPDYQVPSSPAEPD